MISGDELQSTRTFILSMTQQQLADRLGVSLRTVGNWEREGVPESREYVVTRAIGDKLEEWRATERYFQDSRNATWAEEPEEPMSAEEYYDMQEAESQHSFEVARDIIEDDRVAIRQFSNELLLEEIARRLKRVPRDYLVEDPKLDLAETNLPPHPWELAAKNPGYSIREQLEGEEENQP